MRLACEATFDVFRSVFASLKEGMSQEDIGKLVEGGFSKMGLHGGRWSYWERPRLCRTAPSSHKN